MKLQKYWALLKCKPTNNKEMLLEGFNQLHDKDKNPLMRLFVKANLDIYYHEFLNAYDDIDQLLPAGFFDDGMPIGEFDYTLNFYTTPIHKIIDNIKLTDNNKPLVVLLNTGSYSPVHLGHLQMMEEAKVLLSNNYNVVGGFLSPSHDKYVSQKYNGTAQYHSDARIALCEEVVSESDWLMVDPWEARYNKQPINFTDVLFRLKNYLKKHINCNIQLAYVFGSDNAGFSWAFVKDGISVCFERPGYSIQFNTVKNDLLLNPTRNFFIPNKQNAYSSKSIREGNLSFLPEKIKNLYFLYDKNNFPIQTPVYLLRDDRAFATKHFLPEVKGQLLNQSLNFFYQNLKSSIQFAFSNYCHMEILSLSTEQQNIFLNSLSGNIINIDNCTYHPSQYSIGVSRVFSLSDGQVYAKDLIARPGLPSIKKQIESIPAAHYQLVDDDIASGRTIELIKKLLPQHIQIDEYIALSKQSFYQYFGYELSYHFHDIVDLRDFLIGSQDGGLVVELPNGNIGRVPYLWPYVSLAHRAKLPHQSQFVFSLSIWNANKLFYSSLPIMLNIEHMDKPFQNTAIYLGFNLKDTMVDFCNFHINKLQK